MYKRITVILVIVLIATSMNVWAGRTGDIQEENIDSRIVCEENDLNTKYLSDEVGNGEKEDRDWPTVSSGTEENVSVNGVGVKDIISENLSDELISADGQQINETVEETLGEEENIRLNEIEGEQETVSSGGADTVLSQNTNNKTEETVLSENRETDKIISKVSIPSNVKIYLDPLDLLGKGEIYSDRYEITNYGNKDVIVKIKSMDVFYNCTQEICTSSENGVQSGRAEKEEINIDMVWQNEDEGLENILNTDAGQKDKYVLYLKAAEYDKDGNFVRLDKGSKGNFYYTGTLDPDSDVQWLNGKIGITYQYEIINQGEEEWENAKEYIEKTHNTAAVMP